MTKTSTLRNLGLALALPAGLALAAGPAQAQETETEYGEQERQEKQAETPRCTVTFAPEMIQAKQPQVDLKAAFSEEIGTTTDVVLQQGSGLIVTKVAKPGELEMAADVAAAEADAAEEAAETGGAEKAEKQKAEAIEPAADRAEEFDVAVLLNAVAAEDGEWTATFQGTEGECAGTLVVKAQAEEAPEMGEPEPPAETEERDESRDEGTEEDPPARR